MAIAKRNPSSRPKTASKTKSASRAKSSSRRKTSSRATSTSRARSKTKPQRRWSAKVAERSDALDLKENIFKNNDPKKIAASLKKSAEHSKRRKAGPYQSAMSMLNFYINRAGKNLSAARKKKLEAAKGELRAQFHRT